MIGRFKLAIVAATALGLVSPAAACGVDSDDSGGGAGSGSGGGKTKALKAGWSTICLTPSWMR